MIVKSMLHQRRYFICILTLGYLLPHFSFKEFLEARDLLAPWDATIAHFLFLSNHLSISRSSSLGINPTSPPSRLKMTSTNCYQTCFQSSIRRKQNFNKYNKNRNEYSNSLMSVVARRREHNLTMKMLLERNSAIVIYGWDSAPKYSRVANLMRNTN
jgi:hypothetical protein